MTPRPIRVVLAKIGLDGHDRGIRIVARCLRDAGMEVIYAGLWQNVEAVARTAADEDADAVGVSLLSGAHLRLVPLLVQAMRRHGLHDVPLVVGGIIPQEDIPPLIDAGAARILGPGATMPQIVECFQNLAARPAVTAPGRQP